MATNHDGYFSRSLALLKKDKGWEKPLLVLTAAGLVPVAGFLGVQGYALEWARLTAWGVDAAPKQKDVRIGECIKSGWRGFLGGAGYILVSVVISALLTNLFGDNSFTSVLGYVITLIAGILYVIGALRATIYQDALAGYRLDRIWDMIARDFEGVTRITIISLVMTLVTTFVTSLLSMLVLLPVAIHWGLGLDELGMMDLEYLDGPTMRFLFFGFIDALVAAAPWLAIIFFIAVLCSTFQQLITTTAVGLWMRNFNVPAWGASDDPLPAEGSYAADAYASAQAYDAYTQQTTWGDASAQPMDTSYGQDVYAQPANSGYVPPEYAQEAAPMPQPEPAPEPMAPAADESVVVQPIVVPAIVDGGVPTEAAPAEAVPAENHTAVQEEAAVEPFVMRDVWEEESVRFMPLPDAPAQESPVQQAPVQQAPVQQPPVQQAAVAQPTGRSVIEVISLTDVAPAAPAEPAAPGPAEETLEPAEEASAADATDTKVEQTSTNETEPEA